MTVPHTKHVPASAPPQFTQLKVTTSFRQCSTASALNSTFRSILAPPCPYTAPMFQVLRTTTFLGLLAAGILPLFSAQAQVPGALPPASNRKAHERAGERTTAYLRSLMRSNRAHHRGRFRKVRPPLSLKTISEKAGLDPLDHKWHPAKSYIVETKGFRCWPHRLRPQRLAAPSTWSTAPLWTRWQARPLRRMRHCFATTTMERLPT